MPNIDYLFYCPNNAFGGLEMQMAKRCLDAQNLGYNSAIALIPESKLHDYAKSLNINTTNAKISIEYLDLREIINIGLYLLNNKVKNCIVGKTTHLSQILAARKIFYPKTKVILYQQMQSGLNKKDWFHNWVYRELDGSIVLTNLMKKTLAEVTIFPMNKIESIPYGLDLKSFEFDDNSKIKLRNKYKIDNQKFVVGYVARFDQHKDQETLIKAFYKAAIDNSILVLVGEETLNQDGYKQRMIDLCNELGISDKVMFLPFMFEVNELMNCFDLFVIPSLSETFGLVIIEAMASNLPVIGVNSGGVPELVENGYNGYLIEQREIDKLSELLIMLKNDNTLLGKLGDNAKIFAHKNFNYEEQKNKFFDFCNSLTRN